MEERESNVFVPEVTEDAQEDHSPSEIAEHVIAAFMSQTTSNPIAEKMTPENIDHFLDTKVKLSMFGMVFRLVSIALSIIAVIVIVVLLRTYDIAAMSDIINTLLTAGVSFAGGYGFGKSKRDD